MLISLSNHLLSQRNYSVSPTQKTHQKKKKVFFKTLPSTTAETSLCKELASPQLYVLKSAYNFITIRTCHVRYRKFMKIKSSLVRAFKPLSLINKVDYTVWFCSCKAKVPILPVKQRFTSFSKKE